MSRSSQRTTVALAATSTSTNEVQHRVELKRNVLFVTEKYLLRTYVQVRRWNSILCSCKKKLIEGIMENCLYMYFDDNELFETMDNNKLNL